MTAEARTPQDAVVERMRRDIDRTLASFVAVAFGLGLAVGWSAESMRLFIRWNLAMSTPPTLERDVTRPRVCVALSAPRGRLCVEWIAQGDE